MIDIVGILEGDLNFVDTQTQKAKNILSVQLGSLEYIPDFGVDIAYFLSEEFKFQTESFKSYLIQVLAVNGINVATLTDTIHNLFNEYEFKLTPPENSGSLIAR